MNICPSCSTMLKTTELYDVYQCPACKLTVTTDDIKTFTIIVMIAVLG